MPKTRKALLPLAMSVRFLYAPALLPPLMLSGFQALEAQLNQQRAAMEQQQRVLEAMDAELKRLKTGRGRSRGAGPGRFSGRRPAPAAVASTPGPATTAKPKALCERLWLRHG